MYYIDNSKDDAIRLINKDVKNQVIYNFADFETRNEARHEFAGQRFERCLKRVIKLINGDNKKDNILREGYFLAFDFKNQTITMKKIDKNYSYIRQGLIIKETGVLKIIIDYLSDYGFTYTDLKYYLLYY